MTTTSGWAWLDWQLSGALIKQHYAEYSYLLAIFASTLRQYLGQIIGTLAQDEIFVYGLKVCLLLLFLYLMHLLPPSSTESLASAPPATTPLIAKELSCDFNFVSEQEKRAAQEAATEAMLEVEEKKRRKRFTKKRKCVSAGPILIALRHQSQRPKSNRKSGLYFEPLSPRDQILENALVLRETPLTLQLPTSTADEQSMAAPSTKVEPEDEDLVALMCVCSYLTVSLI